MVAVARRTGTLKLTGVKAGAVGKYTVTVTNKLDAWDAGKLTPNKTEYQMTSDGAVLTVRVSWVIKMIWDQSRRILLFRVCRCR